MQIEPKYKILVVDDEEHLRHALRLDLEGEGYLVWEASSGNDAILKLRTQSFDAVISDIRMPDGTGLELAWYMMALPAPKPALLFITAFIDIASEDIYACGVEAIISKPFDLADLINPLQKTLVPSTHKWLSSEIAQNCKGEDLGVALPMPTFEFCSSKIKIGRGGLFVEMAREFPQCGTCIIFTIKDSNSDPSTAGKTAISGIGTILWVREVATPGLRSGVGMAFELIDSQSHGQLITWIELANPQGFIPKT